MAWRYPNRTLLAAAGLALIILAITWFYLFAKYGSFYLFGGPGAFVFPLLGAFGFVLLVGASVNPPGRERRQ